MIEEPRIHTSDDLVWALNQIDLGPSTPLKEIAFQTRDATSGSICGWFVSITFAIRDRDTGAPRMTEGRWEFVGHGATRSEVVRTAWLLCELAVRHELMEAFHFQGQRVFDPHVNVKQLAASALWRGAWR